MRMRDVVAVVAVVLVAGWDGGGDGDEIDYYESMREIAAFSDATNVELDEMADNACDLVAQAVDAGESNEDAVDRVFQAGLDSGLNQADALVVAMTIVGENCPIDISQ